MNPADVIRCGLAGLVLGALQPGAVAPLTAAELACEPAGELGFVCGPRNPEDLVRVPGTRWIIASGMAAGAPIYLVDAQSRTWSELFPSSAPRSDHDRQSYGMCPGAPAPGSLVSHGLNLRPGDDGHSTLYVVGHGGREAIEVFDVDANGETPVLTWRGCVPMPEGQAANSVASLADGTLLATIPLRAGVPISDALAGKPTGAVYRWSPGDAAFEMVAGTEQPYPNGIEVSADGQEFYVVSSGLFTATAYSNTNPARVLRRSDTLPIVPDNLHRAGDGRLITAGLDTADPVCGNLPKADAFSLEEFASCPRPFTVLALDPATLQADVLARGPANPKFSNITMALPVGDVLWIGTFAGDRIGYTPSEEPR